jgi:hypothetical protein
MNIYQLYTNEGSRFVSSTNERMRLEMRKYIREKLSHGYSLSEIEFCWSQIHVRKM